MTQGDAVGVHDGVRDGNHRLFVRRIGVATGCGNDERTAEQKNDPWMYFGGEMMHLVQFVTGVSVIR